MIAKAAKARKKADYGSINCTNCMKIVERRSALQRYCADCSQERDLQRKKLYDVEKGRAKVNEKRDRWREQGRNISRDERLKVEDWQPYFPTLAWYRRVEVPFSWSASKNHIFSTTSKGHTFLRAEARYHRFEITQAIAAAVAGQRIADNKLWLDIFVQKASHRGDAVNLVDLICDAVKDAIPLDDRWYSLRTLDWSVCKVDPVIFIGLGQETDIDVQSCSNCGRFLTYDFFQKNKSLPKGVNRVCRDCQAVGRNSKRVAKNRLAAVSNDARQKGIFE